MPTLPPKKHNPKIDLLRKIERYILCTFEVWVLVVELHNLLSRGKPIITASVDNTAKILELNLEDRPTKEILEKIQRVLPYELTEDGVIVPRSESIQSDK